MNDFKPATTYYFMQNLKGKPITVSSSSLRLMEECKRCFWLQLRMGIRRPEGAFPSLPSGMDIAIKNHFDYFRERNELPPELRNKIDAKLFADMKKLHAWRIPQRGIRFVDPKSGITLMGAIDDLLINNSKLITLDFKTRGFPLKEDTHESYQDQMDIYNFLFRKNGHDTENYGYLLFYYPNQFMPNGEFHFHSDIRKIEVNVDNAEKHFKQAIKVLMGELPEEGCIFCASIDEKALSDLNVIGKIQNVGIEVKEL